MLIKRQPKLSWFINFLAILLMGLLIANSILGSIYINNLKKRMAEITDNYFLAERKLQSAIDSLAQSRLDLQKYAIALKTYPQNEDFTHVKARIVADFKKNGITLSSLLLSIKKQEIRGGYMEKPINDLYHLITQYLFNGETILLNNDSNDFEKFIGNLDKSAASYFKAKENIERLAEMLRQKAYEVRDEDGFINQVFPPILIASFFIALIIGGSLIYVSRREVRKSVVEQTTQILTEAYQYQLDCIQTLEICREISDTGLTELKNALFNASNEKLKHDLQLIINNFSYYSNKVQIAFETRKNLHNTEIDYLENSLKKISAGKST